ncbi:ATP-binding protein [Kitasatospora sp. NPDC054939]
MRAPASPAGEQTRRPVARIAALTSGAVLLGAVAAPVGVSRALDADRPLTAAAVGAVAVLWFIAVGVAATVAAKARRLAAALAAQQAETDAALGTAHAAQQAYAGARAEASAARSERDRARAEAVRAEAELVAARAELDRLNAEVEADRERRAELDRIADGVLPEVVAKLRSGASVDRVLAAHRRHPQYPLLHAVAEEVARGEKLRAAALAVCATAAGRVQALATGMHAELREMQHRHDEEVLGDLLRLDHSTAQAGRMADTIAVLTGARSGRRWAKPIAVESVLRGALGRIGAYQRVRLHNASTAAVAGYAAEGVMHALAELLDNATNFSAPPAEVHVYVEEVPAGLAVSVEDSGLGLNDSWLRRAERAVSAEPLDLATLSAGTRLGLAVVGALARKHGLQISFRPSARGGTGVVMLIPAQLVTHPTPESAPAPEPERQPVPASARPQLSAPAPVRAVERAVERGVGRVGERAAERAGSAAPSGPGLAAAPTPAVTDSGLPQRRRGQTLAAGTSRTSPPASAASPAVAAPAGTAPAPLSLPAAPAGTGASDAKPVRGDAVSAAARFGAFRRAALQAQSGGAPTTRPADDTLTDASPVSEKDS